MKFGKTCKQLSIAAALTLGASLVTTASASDAATFEAAYAAAEEARKKAAAVKFEWRDTKKMLKKAKSLADKGEFAKAVKLAEAAKFQGDAGVAQAARQEQIWKDAVLR